MQSPRQIFTAIAQLNNPQQAASIALGYLEKNAPVQMDARKTAEFLATVERTIVAQGGQVSDFYNFLDGVVNINPSYEFTAQATQRQEDLNRHVGVWVRAITDTKTLQVVPENVRKLDL